jgi:hypothetical protein
VSAPTPTLELVAGRDWLARLAGVVITEDWVCWPDYGVWSLGVELTRLGNPDAPVPQRTRCYLLVRATYPWGHITVVPAKDGGITTTTFHQNFNAEGSCDVPWRTGIMCVADTADRLAQAAPTEEPTAPETRLARHVERAVAWLEAANRGHLAVAGEPFELPPLPAGACGLIAFNENPETFARWSASGATSGEVELARLRDTYVAWRFTAGGRTQVGSGWGAAIRDAPTSRGVWIRIPECPVASDWRLPTNWREFRQTLQALNVDCDALLRPLFSRLRDRESHPLLIGFPISSNHGGVPEQMYWLAVRLPALTAGSQHANGFRPNELGYWQRDRSELLSADTTVQWFETENWHRQQRDARGQLPSHVRESRVLLLGAGTLGSAMGELLVRGGCTSVVVVDGQPFTAGNLARHALTLTDLGQNKAVRLAARLNHVSPFADVQGVPAPFPPPASSESTDSIEGCELVIDCTADDGVAAALEQFPWHGMRRFVSCSFGWKARRLFCFHGYAAAFPNKQFRHMLSDWLNVERQEFSGADVAREQLGCWNPVFPARHDEVVQLAAAAVQWLASTGADSTASLTVFERGFDGSIRRNPDPPH